jgi:hypothetical protein
MRVYKRGNKPTTSKEDTMDNDQVRTLLTISFSIIGVLMAIALAEAGWAKCAVGLAYLVAFFSGLALNPVDCRPQTRPSANHNQTIQRR